MLVSIVLTFAERIAQRNMAFTRFSVAPSLDSAHHKREQRDVNLALRLDVLTVCVVFAFVAAILIGAF